MLAEGVAQLTVVFSQRAHLGGVERHPGVLHLTGNATVNHSLAVLPYIAHGARASVALTDILTGSTVLTGAKEARGGHNLAVPASVAWGTVALVLANVVEAGAPILAGPRGTGVRLTDLAVLPGEAVGAGAVVLAICLPAGAPIATGSSAAEPWLGFLTVLAKEASRTLAGV